MPSWENNIEIAKDSILKHSGKCATTIEMTQKTHDKICMLIQKANQSEKPVKLNRLLGLDIILKGKKGHGILVF